MSANPKAGQLRDRSSNRQLAEGALQLECDSGAVSVVQQRDAVSLTVVRGVPGRKAQVARLNRDQTAAVIGLLLKAMQGLPGEPVAMADFDMPAPKAAP